MKLQLSFLGALQLLLCPHLHFGHLPVPVQSCESCKTAWDFRKRDLSISQFLSLSLSLTLSLSLSLTFSDLLSLHSTNENEFLITFGRQALGLTQSLRQS